jgi:hypothetical protein
MKPISTTQRRTAPAVIEASGSAIAAAILSRMHETLRGVGPDRLERSFKRRRDSIRFGPGAPGIERAEVYLSACAFETQRHRRAATR